MPRRRCGAGRSVLTAPWRDVGCLVVDLETTGLDLATDSIVSVGLVPVERGRILVGRSVYRLVRPERPVPPGAAAVHALRTADLAAATPVDTLADDLLALLPGRVLVAHAAWIERAFLDRVLAPCGRRTARIVLDTAGLARALGWVPPAGSSEPSLELLARRRGLPVHTPHHALGDALTTASVLLAQAADLGRSLGREPTVGDLYRASRRAAVPRSGRAKATGQ